MGSYSKRDSGIPSIRSIEGRRVGGGDWAIKDNNTF